MLQRLNFQPVGLGQHRSGWPYCLQHLESLFTQGATVVLDDFIERTFFYDSANLRRFYHSRPWVGIFHHPPDMPEWYMSNLRLQQLHNDSRWRRSVPHLQLIVTMGEALHEWCQEQWPKIPCVMIRHPTGLPLAYWDPQRFRQQPRKRLIQVGWFLRNMLGIQHVPVPPLFDKVQLKQKNEWIERMTAVCAVHYDQTHPMRRSTGPVTVLEAVSDQAYDELLADSVVFMEVVSAVANNTVVECIIRNTPICVNRHPGPVGYLGKDYPLFYDELDEVPSLLTVANIMKAHQYLRQMDKWWIHGGAFREQLRDACRRHVPACRVHASADCHELYP